MHMELLTQDHRGAVLQFATAVSVLVATVAVVILSARLRLRIDGSRGNLIRRLPGRTHSLKLLWGFCLAILASASWGIGGVITKYSAEKYPVGSGSTAVADIGLANYVSGTATVLLFTFVAHLFLKRSGSGTAHSLAIHKPFKISIAAFFKGANTYAFTAAVALISAAAATIVENLNVLWTALLVSVIGRRVLSVSWFGATAIVLLGTALTVGVGSGGVRGVSGTGLWLALLAGVAFSIYVITWNRVGSEDVYAPQRGLETGVFLGLTALMLLITHVVVGASGGGSWLPFSSLHASDLMLQLMNGVFNIGFTYFLIGEALRVLGSSGPVASLLLSLGISYAVLFTVLGQYLLLGESITSLQWVGVLVFTAGFAFIRFNLTKIAEREPSARGIADSDSAGSDTGSEENVSS